MILRFRKITRYFLFLSDLLFINGSVFWGRQLTSGVIGDDAFLRYTLLLNLLWVLLVLVRDRYQPVTFVNVSKAVFRLLFTHFLLLITVIYLFDRNDIPRSFIVVHYVLLSLFVLVFRYLYIFVYRRFALFKYDKRRVVIIGNGEMSYKAATYLGRPDSGYEFVGVFNDVDDPKHRLPMLGSKSECIDYCIRNNVKEIFSTLMPESGEDFRDLINRAEQECIRVKFIPDFKMIFARDVKIGRAHV
jgi:FlaA1/EpsC-like NDP-sugar epimerase